MNQEITCFFLYFQIHNFEELQGLADNLLPEAAKEEFRVMNEDILRLLEEIDQSDALLKNLDDIIPKISEVPSTNRGKLLRIGYELAQKVEAIPLENGVTDWMDGLNVKTFTHNPEYSSEEINAFRGVHHLIQKLEESFRMFDMAHSQLKEYKKYNKSLLIVSVYLYVAWFSVPDFIYL